MLTVTRSRGVEAAISKPVILSPRCLALAGEESGVRVVCYQILRAIAKTEALRMTLPSGTNSPEAPSG